MLPAHQRRLSVFKTDADQSNKQKETVVVTSHPFNVHRFFFLEIPFDPQTHYFEMSALAINWLFGIHLNMMLP